MWLFSIDILLRRIDHLLLPDGKQVDLGLLSRGHRFHFSFELLFHQFPLLEGRFLNNDSTAAIVNDIAIDYLEGVAILKVQRGATPAVVKARFVNDEMLQVLQLFGPQRLQGGCVLQGSLAHLNVAHVCVVARIEAYVIDRDFKLLENQVSH